jgi:hypothetical protein
LVGFPGTASITGATNVTPIVITAAGHGFATGETVVVSRVIGNTAANGSFTITRIDDNTFSLNGSAGNGAYSFGGRATIANILITDATNENPVRITTAAAHGLHDRERVTIAGVAGNTAANGTYTVTKVSDTAFTLDGVKGNAAYTSGGTAITLDFHHRNITDWLVQFDCYRKKLPPPIPANRKSVASWFISRYCAPGDRWENVKAGVEGQIATWNSTNTTDAGFAPVIPAANSTWNPSDYVMKYLLDEWTKVAEPIMTYFTPKNANPKSVSVIRWPFLHDQSFGIIWEGQSFGHGQSLIHSRRESTTLYSHEMGHSMHLVHFLGGNFGWKHHDLNFPQCMMSYSHISHSINKPVGGVGVDGDSVADGGWPDAGPQRIFFEKLRTLGIALDKPCARCMLKLQGWNEEVLPAAWTHPDLF